MLLKSGTHETEDGRTVAEWFGQVVGKPQFGPYAAMGWQNDKGEPVTAVLFNDYNGANIEMHMVGTFGRQRLREVMRYAFLQLNVQRITAKPYRSNVKLRETVMKLGFEPEGVMKRYYGPSSDDDAIVYRLDRQAAEKWMT
jgi:RimJ/RimL family protein N-acetyltransferase